MFSSSFGNFECPGLTFERLGLEAVVFHIMNSYVLVVALWFASNVRWIWCLGGFDVALLLFLRDHRRTRRSLAFDAESVVL